MKHLKKLGSVLLALVMVLALAAPAFAAEVWDPDTDSTTHKITIGGEYKTNYTYGVYQIFKGTEYPSATLNEVKWGYHLKGHEKAFVDALMADTELMKHYPANLLGADEVAPNGVTADTVAKKVADWLDAARVGLGEEKAAQILVGILSSQSVGVIGAVTSSTAWPISTDDANPTQYQSGYYLIQGKENIENSEPFYNLFQLTEDKTVAPKGAGDSDLDKKVAKQTVDATGAEIADENLQWKDAADFNIGDALKFKITAQLPDNFAILGAYEMLFTDTQDAGLADVTPGSFTATLVGVDATGAVKATQPLTQGTDYMLHLKGSEPYPAGWPANTTEKPENQKADAAFQVWIPNARAAGGTYKTFTDAHDDLKFQIVLTYSSQLTGDAVITGNTGSGTTPDANADGNNNNIKLNCKWDGKESNYEDDTPVYTFEFDVNKVDGATPTPNKVYGAKFALYQWKDDNTEELTDAQIKAAIAALTNGTLSAEEAAKWEAKTFVESDFEGDKTTDGAHFACEGLEAGNYMLIETKTPDNYNGLKTPVFFKLEAKYKDEGVKSKAEAKVTELKAMPYKEETLPGSTTASWVLDTATGSASTGDVDSGKIEMPVANKQGTQLPETGGIGTTIFYIVGGVLVLGAVVLLITKRRTSVDDE